MNTSVVITSFLVLILVIALIPYKKERFDMQINLDNMSCIDYIKDVYTKTNPSSGQQLLNTIMGNNDRVVTVTDMDRAVIPVPTLGNTSYNDSTKCVIREDRLRNYNIDFNTCVMSWKAPDNQDMQIRLQKTDASLEPKGCVVDFQDPSYSFIDFVDNAFYVKNKQRVDKIDNLNGQVTTLTSDKVRLNNNITDLNSQLAAANAKANSLQNDYNNLNNNFANQANQMAALQRATSGKDATSPAASALDVKSYSGTTLDGVYYINCNGVSTPTFCLMDPRFDGGGWMLLMKMTSGNTFNFNSPYWKTANTLNPMSYGLDGGVDAKFNVFNTHAIKDVLAVFPSLGIKGGSIPNQDMGWTWMVKNWYYGNAITALDGFQKARNATPEDPKKFSGWSDIFSSQEPSRKHVFGGHSHLSGGYNNWGTVRWGFVFNENAPDNYASNDVWTGIGGTNFSAGDYFGCCGRAGFNHAVPCFLFGR